MTGGDPALDNAAGLEAATILQAFRVKSAAALLLRRIKINGAVAGRKATQYTQSSDIDTCAGYNDPEKSIPCSQRGDYEN
jgi:hypothetical protein